MSDVGARAWLAVVGDLVEDVVVWYEQEPRPGTDNPATIRRSRGGSAANVAAFAAGLVPSRFIGRVGADATGALLVDQLAGAGVDVRAQRAGYTGTVLVLVDQQGERTMFPDRAAATELADVPESWVDGVRTLHIPAYTHAAEPCGSAAIGLAELVRERGGAVTMDASSTSVLESYGLARYRELITALRPEVLFANAAEAESLGDPAAWLPPDTVLVRKNGVRPTELFHSGGKRTEFAVPFVVPARDTTGAGDAFAAGYLAATLDGAGVPEAVMTGHRLAARVLGTPGATITHPETT